MKVLLTGGAGYIGSHTILNIFDQTDWEVVSVDNYVNSSPSVFDRLRDISKKSVINYEVDITDIKALEKVFKEHRDIKAIIHFAAYRSVRESVLNPLKYYKNNLDGMLNVLFLQNNYKIPFHIFSSSCSVYGDPEYIPVDEHTKCGEAKSPYAHTKQICEGIIQRDVKVLDSNYKALILRYFNPAGSHPSGKQGEVYTSEPEYLFPYVGQVALGKKEHIMVHGNDYNTKDGTCLRDFIHISDIASAHVLALKYMIKSQKKKVEILNLGSGKGYTVLEVIRAFEKVNGIRINHKFGDRRLGDVEAIYASNRKAYEKLGWKPKYTLKDMVASFWKWEKHLHLQNKF